MFRQVRTAERARKWTLEAMVGFWVAVAARAPASLRAALDECFGPGASSAMGFGSAPSSFFERAQNLRWAFFQEVFSRFIAALAPECLRCFESDLRALLPAFPEMSVLAGTGLTCPLVARACGRPAARVPGSGEVRPVPGGAPGGAIDEGRTRCGGLGGVAPPPAEATERTG